MTVAVAAEGLTKRFGDLCAVSELDLTITPGETLGLLGPNGAGKSTTLNLILGLTRPDAGSVKIFGQPSSARAARQTVGYVAQDCDFPPNLTVREILRLVRSHFSEPLAEDEVLDRFGLDSLADRQVGGFSGGQRRRLAVALAFAGGGRMIVLDEPTTGLDSAARADFWAMAQAYVKDGGTILLTTHHLEEIEAVADRICLIDRGRIRLQGGVDDIKGRIARKYVSFCGAAPPVPAPVDRMEERDGRVHIVTADADAVVRRLVASGGAFSDLTVRGATLEEAIAELATDSLGDAA